MKPGPKPSPTSRRGRATAVKARPDLPQFDHAPVTPVMPDYLATDAAMEPARVVWIENNERVIANGCTDRDSDLFARYCIQEAAYRARASAWLSGEDPEDTGPKTAAIESLRKMAELLGIAGPTSRQRMAGQQRAPGNSFARNGTPPTNRNRA